MTTEEKLIENCKQLLDAYTSGKLSNMVMPEDASPAFTPNQQEDRLAYFTLPMALNYQRNSYQLWKSALDTWNDVDTKDVFDVEKAANMPGEELRAKLLKY